MQRKVNKIILHCSDFAGDHDIKDITQWHIARGFSTVGYQYVITADGTLQIGRSEGEVGAHTKGHNKDSIGICLCGKSVFHKEQYNTLRLLLKELFKKYPGVKFYGHYEFDKNKTCPNIDMNWLRSYLGIVQ